MSEKIFFFPGQGSQFPGMAKDLYERYSPVKALFEEASDACRRDMKALLFESDADELKDTKNAQPAILLASLAARAALAEEGLESTGAAGHSLGEYTALVDAGVLSVEDGFKAVSARGEFMSTAGESITAEKGEIGMSAVIGIGPEAVRQALEGHQGVWSANENGMLQVAIGGTKAAIAGAAEDLKAAGARRLVPLQVSCPFHTPLMSGPAESMQEVLEEISFSDPVKTVWSNVTAEPIQSAEQARSLLVEQITHSVRWLDLMASVAQTKASALYEVGPGKVLCGLWAKSDNEGTCLPAGSVENIEKFGEK